MNVSGFGTGSDGGIRMKKLLALFWVLICMLSLVACDKATGSEEPVTGGAVSDMPEVDKNVSGYYHSESGTFNDKENNQNLSVTAKEKESINVILVQYITLGLE